MGAIQGSINTMLGSAAAAALAGKKMADDKAVSEEQGLLAKEQFHEASADITKLTGESEIAESVLAEKKEASAALMDKMPGGKGNTKKALEEKRARALTEVEAAQRAFDELQDRIEAKKAMMSRAEKIMKRTNTWGGVR